VEAGILDCDSLLSLSALRFGFRLVCSDVTDPCKRLVFEQKNATAVVMRHAAGDYGVQMDDQKQIEQAHAVVEGERLERWARSPHGVWQLKGLKLTPGPSEYLLEDGRRLAAVRARLRLNRCSLNASLAQRRLVLDPNCTVCAVPETVEHCLLECPRYEAPRRECAAALDFLRLPLNFATVLGSVYDRGPEQRRSALAATGKFLQAIDNIRKL
jgi:hypothetical protein